MKHNPVDEAAADSINIIAGKAYRNSFEKGFWDEYMNQMSACKELPTVTAMENMRQFITILWGAKNLMEASGELGEAIEAERTNKQAHWEKYKSSLQALEVPFDAGSFAEFIKDSKGDEVADCIIRLLQWCAGSGMDIGAHIAHKMAYNQTRQRLHGKKF